MVEKMARAIAVGRGLGEGEWRHFSKSADLAIKAMREPTSSMKVAGSEAWSPKPQNSPADRWAGAVGRTYTAMIDNAIAEHAATLTQPQLGE